MRNVTGTHEAEFLRRVADIVDGHDVGLASMGVNDQGAFTITAVLPRVGVEVSFTAAVATKAIDAFADWVKSLSHDRDDTTSP